MVQFDRARQIWSCSRPVLPLLKGGSGGGGGGNGTTETRPSASADEYFALEMAREASRQHAWGRASAGRPRREPPAETSDLWLLLRRYEEQCSLLNALKARANSSLVVTPSKYEDMVTDFPAWLDTVLLRQLRLDAAVEKSCLLYTSPSPRDQRGSRMPSSA